MESILKSLESAMVGKVRERLKKTRYLKKSDIDGMLRGFLESEFTIDGRYVFSEEYTRYLCDTCIDQIKKLPNVRIRMHKEVLYIGYEDGLERLSAGKTLRKFIE